MTVHVGIPPSSSRYLMGGELFEDDSFASTLFKNGGRFVKACDDPTPPEHGF